MTNSGRTTPRLMLDTRVPMRDGVELSADIYLPPAGDGPWPAILQRTPYDNTMELWVNIAAYFAGQGYAFVSQDVRGRCDSDGEWEPFVNEGPDGHDTIEWIAAQPWCDGKVGMMGGSYGGYVQWVAAKERPPHLAALVSTAAAGRWMEEIPHRFGTTSGYLMFWLNLVGGRTLQPPTKTGTPDWARIMTHKPLRDMDIALGRTNTVWRTWLEHDTFDDYWRPLSLIGHFHEIDLPVLHITGWFDGDQWGELHYWHGMLAESPAAGRQWLLVGPWDHGGTRTPKQQLGGRDFGPASLTDLNAAHLRFFDRWLKGIENGQEQDKRVRLFHMGDGVNEWREHDTWPPAGTVEVPFYFHSNGNANTLGGDGTLAVEAPTGDEPADTYVYNPDDPTPSYQDINSYPPGEAPLDNRWRLRRDDVLVYTSAPFEHDLEITGHPFVVLHAESDCTDTDWYVTLCDVHPDGKSEELTAGVLRAAYRGGLEAPLEPIEPGKIYEYTIELMATCNVWCAGHRLRVTVASANYPDIARNPNTNARIGHDDEVKIAHNRVHHSAEYPSRLLVPVAPAIP